MVFSASTVVANSNGSKVSVVDPYEPMQSTSGPVPSVSVQESGFAAPLDGVLIEGVPSYIWYNGCGPTAVGMVVGYWDGQGFDELVPGSAEVQNEYVDAMIASPGHIADYAYPIDNYYTGILPDKSTLGGVVHESDCVADFMHTSWSSDDNMWGWSWSDMVDDGFSYYAKRANPAYSIATTNLVWNSLTWEWYVHEIDSGHPAVFLVDSDGNGYTDHFVTAIGYGEWGDTKMYACYDTWDNYVWWFEFARMSKGQWFGIYSATCFELTKDEAYAVSKTSGAGITSVSWPETVGVPSLFSMRLDNNGFRSGVVEIFDFSTGKPVKVYHENLNMRSQDAYPFGWAYTGTYQMEPGHPYSIWIGALDGPLGSYVVAYPSS
jgi:hypothetical protein